MKIEGEENETTSNNNRSYPDESEKESGEVEEEKRLN